MKPIETGVYTAVTRENYDRIERVNFSSLKHLKRSPAHYRAAITKRIDEDTDAMRVGRATHVAALEPERFRASHAVWDGGRRYGKEWDKFCATNAGLEILTEDQYQLVTALASAVRTHEAAAKYLTGGAAEVTMLWDHVEPANGTQGFTIQCKGRIDFAPNGGAIPDLKTTRDASPDAFSRQSWDLDYAARAAFYVDGYAAAHGGEVLPFVMIAVEKEEPYLVQVYTMPDALLEMGRDTYRQLLARLAQCRAENRWPGYADGPLELQLPRWMRADNDDVTGLGLVFEGAENNA